jgi:hypothetical protein
MPQAAQTFPKLTVADETKVTKAHQTVYHEENYRSALILPVIPRNRRHWWPVAVSSLASEPGGAPGAAQGAAPLTCPDIPAAW